MRKNKAIQRIVAAAQRVYRTLRRVPRHSCRAGRRGRTPNAANVPHGITVLTAFGEALHGALVTDDSLVDSKTIFRRESTAVHLQMSTVIIG